MELKVRVQSFTEIGMADPLNTLASLTDAIHYLNDFDWYR
jgi:hypothetical protein